MENNIQVVYKQEDSSTSTPENHAESPVSGEEGGEASTPSPRRSRRGAVKRTVSVPISDGERSRSTKGEVYPPPDSWSWRKYGQKPIKGSPYPRGYYRCSSSKGCPARKQVERSRLDPTTLLITYSCEHNHPLPTTTSRHHHAIATTSTAVPASPVSTTAATTTTTSSAPEECAVFAYQADLELENNSFSLFAGELGWFHDVGSTMMESSTFTGPTWGDPDMAGVLPVGEEDESLFGDLGELPECSVVFRRCSVGTC